MILQHLLIRILLLLHRELMVRPDMLRKFLAGFAHFHIAVWATNSGHIVDDDVKEEFVVEFYGSVVEAFLGVVAHFLVDGYEVL